MTGVCGQGKGRFRQIGGTRRSPESRGNLGHLRKWRRPCGRDSRRGARNGDKGLRGDKTRLRSAGRTKGASPVTRAGVWKNRALEVDEIIIFSVTRKVSSFS